MPNLMAIPGDWAVTSASYADGMWTMEVNGAYAPQANGRMNYVGGAVEGGFIQASVSYELPEPFPYDLWLVVLVDDGGAEVSEKIWSGDGSMPTTGSVPLYLDMAGWGYAAIAISGQPYSISSPYSYDNIGTITFDVPVPPPPPDHHVLVRYSKDGGRNWSNWKKRSLGAIGEYQQRVRFTRLGEGYRFVFQIQISSPVKRDLLGASLRIEPRG